MAPDHDDPLLEALLEEVLGGRAPPDLTASILQRWAAPPPTATVPPPEGNGRLGDGRQAWPVVVPPPVRLAARRHENTRRRRPVLGLLAAAAAAVLLGMVFFLGERENQQPPRAPVAQTPPREGTDLVPGGPLVGHRASRSDLPVNSAPREVPPTEVRETDLQALTPAPGSSVSPREPQHVLGGTQTTPPEPPRQASSPEAIIQFVNHRLGETWQAAGVRPTPLASEGEWCRRLFLRVVGRVPSPEELTAFTADRRADKRQRLVQRLVSESPYVAEYARHWATLWTNALIGRTGGQAGSLASREALEEFLAGALAEHRPWDAVVRELLTATGSPRPGRDDYNPAVNFLLDGWDAKGVLATARVARVFLGTQLHCAQCHAHPSQELSQEQFWSLNAFFRQVRVERVDGVPRLVNADFPGEGKGSQEGEVYYETPNGLLKTAFPRFLDGQAIPPQGKLSVVDRRRELAHLVTRSDRFPQAVVNRVWAHFFGYGLTQPVDDVGPQASSPHRELLVRLAEEFAAHGHDLGRLIGWIALSDPFARSSRLVDLASRDMPEAGETPLFSRYYTRPLAAEEVYNALVHAAQLRKAGGSEVELLQARRDWLAQIHRRMGTDDAQEEPLGGVRQSLLMMNGELTRRAVSSQQEGLLKSLLASGLSYEQKVEHLFLAALSRPPSRRELRAAGEILATSGQHEATALEDIWWALLNSSEFVLDH